MAITQAAEHQAAVEARKPGRPTRLPAAAWSTESQLRKSWPIVRLLAEIWAIPQVSKIGVHANGTGIHIWVFLPDDDREAEARITLAERDYLQATSLHPFELDVVPLARVREDILPPFDTVLER
jgi:hypothetical protein